MDEPKSFKDMFNEPVDKPIVIPVRYLAAFTVLVLAIAAYMAFRGGL
jgi:hypothetical protein